MTSLYALLKFIHVSAVIVWLGGLTAVAILSARLARAGDPAGTRAFAQQAAFFGGKVLGAAAGVALLAGIILVPVGRLGMPFWMLWGLIAAIVSMAVGAVPLRRNAVELERVMAAPDADASRASALRSRLVLWGRVNLAILFATVFVMVFKPTF